MVYLFGTNKQGLKVFRVTKHSIDEHQRKQNRKCGDTGIDVNRLKMKSLFGQLPERRGNDQQKERWQDEGQTKEMNKKMHGLHLPQDRLGGAGCGRRIDGLCLLVFLGLRVQPYPLLFFLCLLACGRATGG